MLKNLEGINKVVNFAAENLSKTAIMTKQTTTATLVTLTIGACVYILLDAGLVGMLASVTAALGVCERLFNNQLK